MKVPVQFILQDVFVRSIKTITEDRAPTVRDVGDATNPGMAPRWLC